MSKYLIFGKYWDEQRQKYEHTVWFHTNTKYPNNEPYFSGDIPRGIRRHQIEKKDLENQLKCAQASKSYKGKRHTKYYKIFVLKANSSKLFRILNPKYDVPHMAI